MTARVLLLEPVVYTDRPDEIPELLKRMEHDRDDIDVWVLDLPRGMMSPKREWYVQSIAAKMRKLGADVDVRRLKNRKGMHRTVLVARFDIWAVRWGNTLAETVERNT